MGSMVMDTLYELKWNAAFHHTCEKEARKEGARGAVNGLPCLFYYYYFMIFLIQKEQISGMQVITEFLLQYCTKPWKLYHSQMEGSQICMGDSGGLGSQANRLRR